jgi:hypothetical protein
MADKKTEAKKPGKGDKPEKSDKAPRPEKGDKPQAAQQAAKGQKSDKGDKAAPKGEAAAPKAKKLEERVIPRLKTYFESEVRKKLDLIPKYGLQFLADDGTTRSEHQAGDIAAYVGSTAEVRDALKGRSRPGGPVRS